MKKIVIALCVMLATMGMAFAQSDLQAVAVVKLNKSETITVKQVKARVSAYEKQMGRTLSAADRKMVLDAIIGEKLMLQAALKSGVSVTDSQVDQYFMQGMSQQLGVNVTEKELADLVKKSQGITLDELIQKQVGMSVAEYKAFLKNQLIIQQYVIVAKQEDIKKAAPTDEEIRLFYESNKTSFVWTDMLKVFLVIVPKGSDADAAKLKCNDLRNKYADKKLTGEQISRDSKKEGSGYQAGEILLPKTEQAATGIQMSYQALMYLFSEKQGYISELQETEDDYRFISTGKKYEAKMLSLSDVVQPETTITVYDYIRQNLTNQKQLQYAQVAAQEMAQELYTPANVEMKKNGDALDKLLSWGE